MLWTTVSALRLRERELKNVSNSCGSVLRNPTLLFGDRPVTVISIYIPLLMDKRQPQEI